MNSGTASVPLAAVDKTWPQPYLWRTVSMAIAFILLTFLAVGPRIAYFPLIWRMLPLGVVAVARHGELISKPGTTSRRLRLAARTGFWHDRRARPQVFRLRQRQAGQGVPIPRQR